MGAFTGVWWGNMRERDHLGETGVDWRIILRWIFRKWDVGVFLKSAASKSVKLCVGAEI